MLLSKIELFLNYTKLLTGIAWVKIYENEASLTDLVNDRVQGAEEQESASTHQILSQSHHVTLLLILRPLGHRTTQLVHIRQELPCQGVTGPTHVRANGGKKTRDACKSPARALRSLL